MKSVLPNPWLKLQRTHANLHYIVAEVSRIAVALEIAGRVSAGPVSAHSAHNLAFIDVCAKEEGKKKEKKSRSEGEKDLNPIESNNRFDIGENFGEEWAHRYI